MKDKLFIIITTGLVLLIMIWAPVNYALVAAGVIDYESLGNIITPEKTYDDTQFLSTQLNAIEEGKAKLEDIYTNYLPGYNYIVMGVGTLKADLDQPLYSLYNDITAKQYEPTAVNTLDDSTSDIYDIETEQITTLSPEPDSPVDDSPKIVNYSSRFIKSGVYGIDVEYDDGTTIGLLTLVNTASDAQNSAAVQSQVKEINRIANANTDVNVYVYVCSKFQDSEYFTDYVSGTKSLYQFVEEFFNSLDSRIKYDRLKVDTLEDSIQKLFLTDHHWNAYGAYEGYCDIINMIFADSPSIGEPRALGDLHVIEEAVFYGTNARTCNYTKYTDTFFFYDYNLPEHTIKTTQNYSGFKTLMNEYLTGNFSKSLNTDHYVNFYPYTSYTYYPDNNTGRNLLVLTDSYNRGVTELLGSNFDEMYVFDFRYMEQIGDYNTYIEEHGITDVLFMQYSLRGVFNEQNDNMLYTIKTIKTN